MPLYIEFDAITIDLKGALSEWLKVFARMKETFLLGYLKINN